MESTADLQINSLVDRLDGASLDTTKDGNTEQTLLDRMARFRTNPFNFAHELSLFIRGVDWRAYDNIVGQPVFYAGYTEKIKTAVMASSLLQKKLNELTDTRLQVEEAQFLLDSTSPTFNTDKAKRRAEISSSLDEITGQMIDNMMCKMESKLQIRSAFYLVTQLLTRVYSGIHVSQEEVTRLRKVAAIAAEKKLPIIFLPRHSSHLDYVSLHLVCYRLGLTLPVVVAGDNLNFPIVGPFLQTRGAMWIRRSFDGDALYSTLVQAYLDTLLQQGYNLECFIEGTRSRTGKLLGPKFGILGYLLDSVLSGRTKDAYICPVSMQYDKVIEVDSYVTELLGKPKQKENLADFLSSSSILGLNLGRVDCRFEEPWSLREFIDEQQSRQVPQFNTNLAESGKSSDTRIRLLRTLGYKVLADINAVSVVMPSALVGTVLLTLRGRGVGRIELGRRVDWLCERILANGGNVADFHGMPTLQVVDRALDVLGPKLVGTVSDLAEPTYFAVDRFQLSFYRNMTIHLFISEALIAAALYTKVKQGGGSASQRLQEDQLTEKVTFLSQLFRGEFIFPAGQGLQRNLEDAMKGLIRDQVLEYTDKPENPSSTASTASNPIRDVGLSALERQTGRENFDFYCFLIWPFCDAAWLGAVSLLCIVPPSGSSAIWTDMKKAQDTAQLLGRTLYHQGDLSYFEAINKEALKNAYSRFQEGGIILFSKGIPADTAGQLSGSSGNDKGNGNSSSATITTQQQVVRIAPEWTPERDSLTGEVQAKGKLWDFIEKIAQFRREGKNRRDGATVSMRVLALTARLNKGLFDVEALTEQHEAALTGMSQLRVKRERKRRSRL